MSSTAGYLQQLETKFNEATALLKQLVLKQKWDDKSVIFLQGASPRTNWDLTCQL